MHHSQFEMQHAEKTRGFDSVVFTLTVSLLLIASAGCSYLFYPRADEFLEKAKGASGVDTLINLTTMLEASAKAAHGGQGYDPPLNDLHNQFHALKDAFCDVTKEQAASPAYAKAVTIHKELWTIFRRLWKYRDEQPGRDIHLDLLGKRILELREALQAVKG